MIVFFVNLLKPTRQTLRTIQPTIYGVSSARSFTKSKIKTLPKKFERVRDHGLDDCMEIEKRIRKILKFQEIILSQSNKTLPVTRLNLLARRIGFKRDEVGVFILKYPHVFEVYEHPVQRILFCRFTRKAMAQMDREANALSAQIDDAVICLRKLVMMSNSGRIRLEHVRIARRAFGLPDDFESSVILKHPEYFRLIDADAETRRKYIECVEKDPSLTVCAIERAREREYRARGSDSEDNNRFAFLINYPNGFRMKKFFRSAVLRWQRVPYWSPYEDVSGYDMRSVEAKKRMEKRAVASIHELLSLTVEKRMTLERIAHFRNALDLPNKMKEFLLRHQGIFYISTRGNQGKIHTVFLREAYRRGSLIEPNDLYLARRQLGRLVLMGSKGLDVDDELIGFSRERKRGGFVRGYVDDASRGVRGAKELDEGRGDRGSSFDLSNVDDDDDGGDNDERSVDNLNDDGIESSVDNDDNVESSVDDDDDDDDDHERSVDV